MLSMEQRANRQAYAFKNGMTNLGVLIGFVVALDARGGVLAQTSNANHGLPFEFGPHDKVPRSLRIGSVVKLVGRMEGRRTEGDEPSMVFRVLYTDNPRVMEMPPEENWFKTKPAEAPDADVAPQIGQFAIRFAHDNQRYNTMTGWGYISAIRVRRAGVVQADGTQSNGCLYLLLQQTADPAEAIPVRLYGNAVNAYLNAVRIGQRVKFTHASMRADVKPIGDKPEDGSPQLVKILYFVKARELKAVLPDDFQDGVMPQALPDWVLELRQSNERARAERIRQRNREPAADEADGGGPPSMRAEADAAEAGAVEQAGDRSRLSEEGLMALLGQQRVDASS